MNSDKLNKSEAEWREVLDPEQYRVLREKGTERAFSGKLHDHKGKGIYTCAGCGQQLSAARPSMIPAPAGPVSMPPSQSPTWPKRRITA